MSCAMPSTEFTNRSSFSARLRSVSLYGRLIPESTGETAAGNSAAGGVIAPMA